MIRWSRQIRTQINKDYSFHHPLDKNIKGCSHILWGGKPKQKEADASGDAQADASAESTETKKDDVVDAEFEEVNEKEEDKS